MKSRTSQECGASKASIQRSHLRLLPLATALAAIGLIALPAWTAAGPTRSTEVATQGLLGGMAEPLSLGSVPSLPQTVPSRAPTHLFVVDCDDSGPGSLRDVINGAVSGDTVDMSQLTCSTISLTSGALFFAQSDLTLIGPGRNQLTIDASASTDHEGILQHLGTGLLTVEDLTLTGGKKYRGTDSAALGGCIRSQGNVIVRQAAVTDCVARGFNDLPALGGGIWSQGSTYLGFSEVSGNFASADDDYASGGGVYALGGFTSLSSVVASNHATSNPNIHSFGGGVFARGPVAVLESTIANNVAYHIGGLASADNGDHLTQVYQSTISGNIAGQTGGMYSRRPLYLYASTIAYNTSASSFDFAQQPIAAGLQMGPENLIVHSTIIAGNVSNDTGMLNDLNGRPGVIVAGTNNLFTAPTLPPPPDTIGGPAGLGPLQDNGGFGPTHALLLGQSLAIDAGGSPTNGSFLHDQRGSDFPRQIGSSIDIGAFEYDPDRIFINGFNYEGALPLNRHLPPSS